MLKQCMCIACGNAWSILYRLAPACLSGCLCLAVGFLLALQRGRKFLLHPLLSPDTTGHSEELSQHRAQALPLLGRCLDDGAQTLVVILQRAAIAPVSHEHQQVRSVFIAGQMLGVGQVRADPQRHPCVGLVTQAAALRSACISSRTVSCDRWAIHCEIAVLPSTASTAAMRSAGRSRLWSWTLK